MKKTLIGIALGAATAAHAYGIENNGEVVQQASLTLSPVTAVAAGAATRALAGVNVIVGNVSSHGSVRQTATLVLSPVTAVAVGVGSDATAVVNGLVGR